MATTRLRMSLLAALMAAGCGESTAGPSGTGGGSGLVAGDGAGGVTGGMGGAVAPGGAASTGGMVLGAGGRNSEPTLAGSGGTEVEAPTAGGRIAVSINGGRANQENGGGPDGTSGIGAQGGLAPMPLPDGLVVHEWGTNTVVSASDGTLELGLQHEEEDLPPFVYDRLRATAAYPKTTAVTTKMETPILYFYAKDALDVSVRVDFPTGILTQWYPGALDFRPQILWENPLSMTSKPQDPAMDPTVSLPTLQCEERYRRNGWLDWGRFRVLGRSEVAPAPPDAPKAAYTWSYARDVEANYVLFPSGESERFLFYRGLSNAVPPVTVRALGSNEQGRKLVLNAAGGAPAANVFVVRVEDGRAAFTESQSGVAAGAELEMSVPANADLVSIETYSTALGGAMTRALETQGLFHDESVAMVNTWKRQWFETPGIRVLYFAPRVWTDATIPLQLAPTPTELVRVMVMRAEVLTPELEASDVTALSNEGTLRAYFSKLGRFAEPRLRRALAQAPSVLGQTLLDEMTVTVSRDSATE